MRNVFLLATLFGVTIIGCTPNGGGSGFKYNEGTFPSTATNLGSINSAYDDYNSALPTIGSSVPLVFSSNRNSQGKDFDFIYKWIDIIRSRTDGTYQIGESTTAVNGYLDSYSSNANIEYAISRANSSADELGPYLVSIGSGIVYGNPTSANVQVNHYVFLYATNVSGNLDIRFSENKTTGTHGNPVSVDFLNSPQDDAYPCITKDSSTIYFCSNRGGNFDIYKARLPVNGNGFLAALKENTAQSVLKDTDLSSGYDDKCPFIIGTTLLFTSNRPGGFGGYDLYYSKLENDKWSAPVNFGPNINTASDEYRPIVVNPGANGYEFTNNFMLFSSNRPGGKGGFDLYYAGIDK
ncbi:MAG: hypothetical protein ABI581_12430 [Sediminibacterium sp.]